jgi:hypothetical protein
MALWYAISAMRKTPENNSRKKDIIYFNYTSVTG